MGDRGAIVIRDKDDEVFLSTHWHGSELPLVTHKSLALRTQWKVPNYLARIIFCAMVKGQEAEVSDFGISSSLSGSGVDGDHPLIVLDVENQTVLLEIQGPRPRDVLNSISFEDAATIPPEDWIDT